MSLLNRFLTKLTKLNQGNTKYGKAPHKPVLLLSIIELIEKGSIRENRVFVNTDLVGTFLENWRLLVDTEHSADFTQPFYYMQSEKLDAMQFWFLQPKEGCQINSYIRSVNILSSVLNYGYFSENIFLLLANPVSRDLAKATLVETYFPKKKEEFLKAKRSGQGYFNDLESYLLNEPDVPYQVQKTESEEDLFVRGGLFKKIVPKVYESTCCITGMRIESTYGHNFIDACHIIPFSISHNDKINNGIALCPNLHRAFDRGLIGINQDYRVLISAHMIENSNHPYNLTQLKDVEIRLPTEDQHLPDLESLKWHRENIFKG